LIGALMKVTELSARPGSVAQRPIDSGGPVTGEQEPVGWQWHVGENCWTQCDRPSDEELRTKPDKFRPVYLGRMISAPASHDFRNSGESDLSVTPDCAGAGTANLQRWRASLEKALQAERDYWSSIGGVPVQRAVDCGEPVAWRYKCHDGELVYMEKRLTDEQKARGYYRDEEDDFDLDDEDELGPFQWSEETPLYTSPPAPLPAGASLQKMQISPAQARPDCGALEDLISTFEQMRGYPEGDSNDPCFDLCGMPCCNEFGCLHAKVRAVRALAHSSTDKSGAA